MNRQELGKLPRRMFSARGIAARVALTAALPVFLLTAGCGGDDNTVVLPGGIVVTVTPTAVIVSSGHALSVTADAGAGAGLTYSWSAAAGHFTDPTAATTMWYAPDMSGSFPLTAVVSDGVSVGIASTTVDVSTYVPMDTPSYAGAVVCAGCHAQAGVPPGDQYNPWLKHGHATAVDSLRDIGQGDNGYCLGCHTVGKYGLFADEALDNGGYDETRVPRLEGIQCENCHGPGSEHPSINFFSVEVSLDAAVCGDCHTDEHHPTYDEWLISGHATPIGFAAGRASCAKCHNGVEGPRYLDDPINYTNPPADPTVVVAHTCAVCHDPHGNDNPGHLRDASVTDVVLPNAILQPRGGAGRLCMSCHNGRRQTFDVIAQIDNGSSHFGPHHSVQGDMLSGVNAYEDLAPGFPWASSQHILVEDACVTCHRHPNDGDLANGIPNFTGHTFEPTVEACENCHGEIADFAEVIAKEDYDGDGMIEGVQEEVEGLLDLLMQTIIDASVDQAARDAFIADFEDALGDILVSTRMQREAGYNWAFVDFDGSHGVHNATYAVQLLQQSILYLDPGALNTISLQAFVLTEVE